MSYIIQNYFTLHFYAVLNILFLIFVLLQLIELVEKRAKHTSITRDGYWRLNSNIFFIFQLKKLFLFTSNGATDARLGNFLDFWDRGTVTDCDMQKCYRDAILLVASNIAVI